MVRLTAGIDIGSMATKAVIFDGEVRGEAVVPTGWEPKEAGLRALREALGCAGLPEERLDRVIGTGYGRVSLPIFDRKVTEITCHARGAYHLRTGTRTVIDIGGQDSKVIALNSEGAVVDFIMNDKCAAGTGRFLQVMAGALDVSLDGLGALAADAEPAPLSSMCTVFAESEIVGLLASGVGKESIAAGIIASIARRVQGLAGRVPVQGEITFTGGTARNPEICRVVAAHLGVPLHIPANPQMVGALGAALIGWDA